MKNKNKMIKQKYRNCPICGGKLSKLELFSLEINENILEYKFICDNCLTEVSEFFDLVYKGIVVKK